MKLRTTVISLGLIGAAVGRVSAQCQPQWSDWFQGNAVDGQVLSMVVYDDDGPGPHLPELYVGGRFTHINAPTEYGGGEPSNWIAKWNGAHWAPVGFGIINPDESGFVGELRAMTTFDPRPGTRLPKLIVAGRFDHSPWWSSNRIQAWDGQQWTSLLGTPTQTLGNGDVYCLVVHDADGDGPDPPEIYAGGNFDLNLEERWPSRGVARWDGTGWHGLSTGVSGYVRAMVSFDDDGSGPHLPRLVVGGRELSFPGVDHYVCVAQWDGKEWSPMDGLSGETYSFVVFDEDGDGPRPPALFAIGQFEDINSRGSGWIARWDGSAWSTVGSPPDIWISENSRGIAFDSDGAGPQRPCLYVRSTERLARWDGTSWSSQASPWGEEETGAMCLLQEETELADRPTLFIASSASTDSGPIGQFSEFDGQQWDPVWPLGLSASGQPSILSVNCMTVGPDDPVGNNKTALYVAGEFQSCGESLASGLAKWDGRTWYPIDRGLGQERWWTTIKKMAFFKATGSAVPELYVETIQNLLFRRSVEGTWTQIGTVQGSYSGISAFIPFDDGLNPPSLFAIGQFTGIDDVPAQNIARWDGTYWHAVGPGLDGELNCGLVFCDAHVGPPALFIGGYIRLCDGSREAAALVKWDGTKFLPVDCPLTDVFQLAVFDEDGQGPVGPSLVAAGGSSPTADPSMYALARWDGEHWTGFSAFTDWTNQIFSLACVFEDGLGTLPQSLIVIGDFRNIGGVRARGAARWQAGQWSAPFGDGLLGSDVSSMVAFHEEGQDQPPALYLGGSTSWPYARLADGITRWGQPIPFVLKQASSRSAVRGSSTVFNIHASGVEPLSYQWRKDGRPLIDCPGTSGSASASLHLDHINQKNIGDYDVVITNACGSVTSKSAHLSLGPPAGSSGTH